IFPRKGLFGISPSFPGLFRTKGYVPTCYSPVCRSPCGALDLHVLGLPPAFALSQDQTLKLDENFSRLITTFDEVPLPSCARTRARPKTAPARRFTTRVLT